MTAGHRQRILIVDDNEAGRYAVGRVLRQAGYEVVEAGTGSEGLQLAASEQPDLALLDVRLPDMNGVSLSGRIKSNPVTASILVLQMSASVVDASARVEALDGGADGYLSSPVEPALLVATVRSMLRVRVAEQAVHQSALEWQTTFDAICDGVALLDWNGAVRRFNAAFPSTLGLEPGSVEGRNLDDLIPPAAGQPTIAQMIGSRRRSSVERVMGERTLGITTDPVNGSPGRIHAGVAIITDVTERKLMDQRLWESQKLESIGLLAGGVAHDFNNLLMGILGNASLALDCLNDRQTTTRALQDVVRASERAADLTRQLLAYAGKGRFVVGPVSLTRLVQELLPLIQSSIPRKVQVNLDLTADLPAVEADRSQLEQLVMNLIINGAEAIGEGTGTVTVSTRVCRVGPEQLSRYLTDQETGGNYISLEVRDTGSGMDEETRRRIFDPFFSTKFLGRGLGLSAALGTVRGHKGAIRVSSTPGQGTIFEVLFPAGQAIPVAAPHKEEGQVGSGSGTILVVDDEQIIRRLVETALARAGFEVLLAENGAEGLQVFSRNASRISLVVLDLVMPVMSGEEALPHFNIMKPGVPVIVSSGQDEEECMRKLGHPQVAGFLQKPYRPGVLVKIVKNALANPTGVMTC